MDDNAATAQRPERNRSFGHGRDSFAPLGPECTWVAIKPTMSPMQMEQIAGLLEARKQTEAGETYSPEEVEAYLDEVIDRIPDRRTG